VHRGGETRARDALQTHDLSTTELKVTRQTTMSNSLYLKSRLYNRHEAKVLPSLLLKGEPRDRPVRETSFTVSSVRPGYLHPHVFLYCVSTIEETTAGTDEMPQRIYPLLCLVSKFTRRGCIQPMSIIPLSYRASINAQQHWCSRIMRTMHPPRQPFRSV
jgi:hypothetical protein